MGLPGEASFPPDTMLLVRRSTRLKGTLWFDDLGVLQQHRHFILLSWAVI